VRAVLGLPAEEVTLEAEGLAEGRGDEPSGGTTGDALETDVRQRAGGGGPIERGHEHLGEALGGSDPREVRGAQRQTCGTPAHGEDDRLATLVPAAQATEAVVTFVGGA
jgi:hypothetical protein